MNTRATFEDIDFSYPSYDDDDESWTLRHIWFHGTTKRVHYTDTDADGNHEPITSRDVDKLRKELPALWMEYHRWALVNGADPCGNYMVTRHRKFVRNIIVHFSHWIGESEHGLAVTSVRWAKGLQSPPELPEGLQEFLCLKKVGDRWCMNGVTTDDLRDNVGCLGRDYFKTKAEWKEALPAGEIERQIKRIARRSIKLGA